ncbi:stage V sporulation T C-terminal domain-containing protein [Fournierella massiliensis]|uniref:stage V sporulation T C-terminal domain-containing protein n=1 Tax=Allofournierella massiliensis TaxID=1650663 RepID=UPI00294263EF|nr:stage V sporulation T C-terminal domain-containing protein [Fournierella massiliensis]
MKATGIVRRIDDLGRVVIPKEIRRTQRIREGDPLEIFTTGAGEVIFKKYSPMGELAGFAAQYAEVLNKALNLTALVCDRDSIIAAAGGSRRDYQERGVSIPLERIMDRRKPFWHSGKAEECVFPCEGSDKHILGACPLLAGGDVAGAVLLLSADKSARPGEPEQAALQIAAAFLAKQVEA